MVVGKNSGSSKDSEDSEDLGGTDMLRSLREKLVHVPDAVKPHCEPGQNSPPLFDMPVGIR